MIPGRQRHQGALARAILPQQAPALALADHPGEVGEERLAARGQVQVVELQHGGATIFLWQGTCSHFRMDGRWRRAQWQAFGDPVWAIPLAPRDHQTHALCNAPLEECFQPPALGGVEAGERVFHHQPGGRFSQGTRQAGPAHLPAGQGEQGLGQPGGQVHGF